MKATHGPAHVKLLRVDTTLAADGSAVSTIHSENQADSAGSVMTTGQISIPYVASYQTLEIIDAYTRKADGKKFPVDVSAIYDQLPQGSAGVPMFTDVHVKTIVFPQFAVGDTAVYTARASITHPIFPGQFVGGDLFPKQIAYDDVQETLTAPTSLLLRTENNSVDFRKTSDGARTIYRWHYSAPSAAGLDPPTINPLAHIAHYSVSSFPDYAALGRAYAEAAAPQTAVTPQIKSLADNIAKGAHDQRAIVRAIYEWVSGHIRYVAVEFGKGSLVPHAADAVLTKGYGDCKDHVALMEALLKAEGIQTEAALINATAIYALTDVPTFSGLDHVITFVPSLNLYLDSTNGLTPYGVLPFAEYGKPVVFASLSSPRVGATPVLSSGLANVTTKTVAHLSKDGALTGTTTTTAGGPYAILLRSFALAVQTVGPETAAKSMLTREGYGGNVTGSLDVPPPTSLVDPFSVSGTFTSDAWKPELDGTQSFYLPGGMRVLGVSGDRLMGSIFDDSKANAAVDIPCYSGEASEDLSLEAPAGAHFSRVPDDTHVKSPNILFDAHWTLVGGTMSVHRHFVSAINQPLCTSSVRAANIDALKTIKDSYNVEVSFGSEAAGQATTWSAPDIADPPKDPKLAAELSDAIAAMQHRHDDDAIAKFSAILAKADVPISASYPSRYDRAMLYLRNFRYEEALADVNAALATAPGDARMLGARALIWFGRADFAQALRDCNAALAIDPANPYLLHLRGNIAMETGRYEDAVRDYTSELQMARDTGALELRAVAYHRLGRESDAAADVDLAVQGGVKPAKQLYDEIIGTDSTQAIWKDPARAPAAIADIPSNQNATGITPANAHNAAYPTLSALLGEAGRVKVRFTVDENGNVSDPKIADSSGFATLDAASLAAVRSWRYNPVRRDGRAVAVQIAAQLRWALQ